MSDDSKPFKARIPVPVHMPFIVPRSAPLDLAGAQRRYLALLLPNRKSCLACGTYEGVELESSRTSFPRICDYKPDGVHTVWEKCTAAAGTPCVLKHASREECPNWPKEDPNAPIPLCRKCAKLHHEYWDDMHREYNAGLI